MNEQIKWIYRIIVVFLITMIIDINMNWRQVDPSAKRWLKPTDMLLIGALVFLVITGWVIMKKNKMKGGRK
jgi:hypothetical protein